MRSVSCDQLFLGLLVLVSTTASFRAAADSDLDIGDRKQFFIDDHLVESKQKVVRELHQPVRYEKNPVLIGDQAWESWIVEAHGRPVVFDPKTKQWMMYYVSWVPDKDAAYHQRYLAALATSVDGIVWKKPRLGQFEWNGSRDNNILNVGQQNWMRRPNVVYDENESDPRRRFKMTFVDVIDGKTAIVRAASPDGIQWHRLGEPWRNSGFGHNLNVLGWDPRNGQYVLFPRVVVERRVGVGRATSKDFVSWTDPKPIIIPEKDETHLEFKGLAGFAYEGAYWGSLWVFQGVERAESELAFSRDGVEWTRPFRGQMFFPRGQAGQWDCEMVLPVAPVVRDDQLWFYYTGWNFPYGPGPLTKVRKGWLENGQRQQRAVGLAKLRLDGFVSLTAGNDAGVVTTKLFALTGDRLVVNVNASQGQVTVEVLDRNGQPIHGFSGDSALAEANLDELRWQPRWKNHADLSALRGQPVRLRFHLRNARLYAFKVQ